MNDSQVKTHIIDYIGKDLSNEVKSLSSDKSISILKDSDTDALKEFTWDALLCELHQNAPVLATLLCKATETRTPRENRNAIVEMCASIILKHRNSKINLVQKIISLILYAGHSSKEVCYFVHKYEHALLTL